MKLISWNVNGIRASVGKGFIDILNHFDADFFCVQETKAQDNQVATALETLEGYHLYSNSAEKKGYSGVAIMCKNEPISATPNIGIEAHDNEGRVLTLEYPNFYLVNVYVPNSGNALKRLDYRAEWDRSFAAHLDKLGRKKDLIVTGDFNVAHQAIDLARPKENYNKTSGYTQTEIDGMDGILKTGLYDSFRMMHPETVKYTFWSTRFNARARNTGWRIDYFLVCNGLKNKLTSATVHDDVMGSDHCPIGLELAI
jgi:exodeoxyribonuclease III